VEKVARIFARIFGQLFLGKVSLLFLQKMGWATSWAIFSQTHPVTLVRISPFRGFKLQPKITRMCRCMLSAHSKNTLSQDTAFQRKIFVTIFFSFVNIIET
jgi:hypothetical protein